MKIMKYYTPQLLQFIEKVSIRSKEFNIYNFIEHNQHDVIHNICMNYIALNLPKLTGNPEYCEASYMKIEVAPSRNSNFLQHL